MRELVAGKELPQHDQYGRQATARKFWRRSDKAAWDYAGSNSGIAASAARDATGINSIVPKHERETDERYIRRLGQTIARPYMRQILDRFSDHVYRVEATRPAAEGEYGKLMKNADGVGGTLQAVMKRATRRAQTEGAAYLLADSSDPLVYTTKAQEQAAGKRGIITIVNADQVIWWRCYKGMVVEAVILMCDAEGVDFGFYVSDRITQRINLKQPDKGVSISKPVVESLDAPVTHSYGGCPLVALQPVFGEDDEPGDSSQGASLAESVKRICNIESWHHEETQACTFTTQVFIGVLATDIKAMEVGPGMAVVMEKDGASVDNIGADPAQSQSLRESLAREITELYRAAGLVSGSPTEVQAPESGVAKAFAFNEVEAKLGAIAQAAQNSENLVVLRLSTGNGWAFPGDALYPIDFALPDLADELDYVIRITTSTLPPLLQEKAIQQYAQLAFRLTDKEQKELGAQLQRRTEQAELDKQTNPPGGQPGT